MSIGMSIGMITLRDEDGLPLWDEALDEQNGINEAMYFPIELPKGG